MAEQARFWAINGSDQRDEFSVCAARRQNIIQLGVCERVYRALLAWVMMVIAVQETAGKSMTQSRPLMVSDSFART